MATQYMFSPQMNYMGGQPAPQAPLQQPHSANGFKNGGFAFRKRFERLDWRKLASVDVEQISRTLDFNALQENIMNITFCNIESELVSVSICRQMIVTGSGGQMLILTTKVLEILVIIILMWTLTNSFKTRICCWICFLQNVTLPWTVSE